MPSDDLVTERLLRVIDEGRRTATYKLALLLALLDAAATHPNTDEIPTRELAATVLAIYYPQARAYLAHDGIARELRQISAKRSSPLQAVFYLHVHAAGAKCRSIDEARQRFPSEYAAALDAIEATFVRYPIPLLQVVGNQALPFLYSIDWPEGTSIRTLRAEGRDKVRLLPGIADRLVALGPLLRPLIELHWTRDVARWTGVDTEDEQLRAHLFGAERASFPSRLRDGLARMQSGRCFYCDKPFTATPQVDHFVAWSRWPNDAIENLVVADRCNGDKSDHLVAPAHVERWTRRFRVARSELKSLAAEVRWASASERTDALVKTTYTHLVAGTPLWVAGRDFIAADDSVLRALAAVVA